MSEENPESDGVLQNDREHFGRKPINLIFNSFFVFRGIRLLYYSPKLLSVGLCLVTAPATGLHGAHETGWGI